ncbi:MAG: sulfate transporter CysZ [Gammaproteobacteria bacterium]
MPGPSAGFATGLRYVWRGARLLRRPGLRRYLVVPVVTNLALFALAALLLIDWLGPALTRWLPAAFEWLRYVLLPLAGLIFALGFFLVSSFIANLVATPFNGYLSSAVLRELRGDVSMPQVPFLEELRRGLAGEWRKTWYFARLALPCALLLLIPGINLLSVVIWPAFGAWALAVEYLDCTLGNQLQPFPAALRVARRERGLAFGFGAGVALITVVPILNFVAMPVGVAAATLLCHERFRLRADDG